MEARMDKKTRRSPGLVGPHTLATMRGKLTTSSIKGSNTRANLGERDAPRFLICVRRSSYGEQNVEVCPGEEQAGDEAAWELKMSMIFRARRAKRVKSQRA